MVRWNVIAAVMLVASCGRIGFEPVTIGPDDARSDAPHALGQRAYLKASNTGAGDRFADDIALSGDGSTLAIGAHLEDSGAVGIDGDQSG